MSYFEIPMKNVQLMKAFEPVDNLNEDDPDFLFVEKNFFVFVLNYFLVEIPIVQEFHNDAESS